MSAFFKKFVNSDEGNILLNAAELSGWEVTVPYGPTVYFAHITKGNLKYSSYKGVLSVNDDVAAAISHNKYLAQQVLKSVTPFVTSPQLFQISALTTLQIEEMFQHSKKLVVKPVDEDNGVGVTPSLETIESVLAAVEKIKKLGATEVMIENHIETINEYRVILWKGEVVDILRRVPAYIIGDGKSTIQKLVTDKNQYRLSTFNGLFDMIKMDDDFTTLLTKKGLNQETILPEQEYLTVETTCNLAQGGETQRIDINTVHAEYHQLFKKVYESTNLVYCGVDLIAPDLSSEPRVGHTAINELNRAPAFTVAFYADIATNQHFYGAKKLLATIEADPL